MTLLLDLLREANTIYSQSISRIMYSSKAPLLNTLYNTYKDKYDETINYEREDIDQQLSQFNNELANAILSQKETQVTTSSSSNDLATPPKFDILLNFLKICARLQIGSINEKTARIELDKFKNIFQTTFPVDAKYFLGKINQFWYLSTRPHLPTTIVAAATTNPEEAKEISGQTPELAIAQQQLAQSKAQIESLEKTLLEEKHAAAEIQKEHENKILALQAELHKIRDTPNGKLQEEYQLTKNELGLKYQTLRITNETNKQKAQTTIAKLEKSNEDLTAKLQTALVKIETQNIAFNAQKQLITQLKHPLSSSPTPPHPIIGSPTARNNQSLRPFFPAPQLKSHDFRETFVQPSNPAASNSATAKRTGPGQS